MTDLYDHITALPNGGRALAAARLRREVASILWNALRNSPLNQVELARRLRVRKSAVNRVFRGDGGNLQVDTIAEYLYELGAELRVSAVPFGTQRREAVEDTERRHLEFAARRRVRLETSWAATESGALPVVGDWHGGSRVRVSPRLATAV
jgi:hypothetical protein